MDLHITDVYNVVATADRGLVTPNIDETITVSFHIQLSRPLEPLEARILATAFADNEHDVQAFVADATLRAKCSPGDEAELVEWIERNLPQTEAYATKLEGHAEAVAGRATRALSKWARVDG